MIAGNGTHEDVIARAVGEICADENITAVRRRPNGAEAPQLELYRRTYKEATGYAPHGLHYIPMVGESETVAVWFGPTG